MSTEIFRKLIMLVESADQSDTLDQFAVHRWLVDDGYRFKIMYHGECDYDYIKELPDPIIWEVRYDDAAGGDTLEFIYNASKPNEVHWGRSWVDLDYISWYLTNTRPNRRTPGYFDNYIPDEDPISINRRDHDSARGVAPRGDFTRQNNADDYRHR